MKRLKARPALIPVMMCSRSLKSLEILSGRFKACGAETTRDGNMLYAEVSSRVISELLGDVCEHSDSVYIGRFYRELYEEHGN